MTIINKKFFYITATVALISITNSSAQSASITVQQDAKFEQLLNEKRRINSSLNVNDRYKIQIFNGDSETSKRVLNEVRREFSELDATIVFSTPAYKVWVGNFKTRIEAERNLNKLSKRYPSALMIRPSK